MQTEEQIRQVFDQWVEDMLNLTEPVIEYAHSINKMDEFKMASSQYLVKWSELIYEVTKP